MKKIHYLPVRRCIHFNIFLTTCKCIKALSPEYMNLYPLEHHPENSGPPIIHYCMYSVQQIAGGKVCHLRKSFKF